MEYDKKLFDEAVEMRNRNAQRSKKWIYEGEFRMPKPGEHFLLNGLVQLVPQVIGVMKEFPIVRPIPDDVVMVPRALVDTLKIRVNWFLNGQTGSGGVMDTSKEIIACAEPEKPKDEILEALKEAEAVVVIECDLPRTVAGIRNAIALREKELKERGE